MLTQRRLTQYEISGEFKLTESQSRTLFGSNKCNLKIAKKGSKCKTEFKSFPWKETIKLAYLELILKMC